MDRLQVAVIVAPLLVMAVALSAAAEDPAAGPARTAPELARAIVMDARALATANQRHFSEAGRYASDPRELAGEYLPSVPAADPTIVVDAYEVCRLLNRSTGFSFATVPDGKPANSRDGCWKSGAGYRFEYLP